MADQLNDRVCLQSRCQYRQAIKLCGRTSWVHHATWRGYLADEASCSGDNSVIVQPMMPVPGMIPVQNVEIEMTTEIEKEMFGSKRN